MPDEPTEPTDGAQTPPEVSDTAAPAPTPADTDAQNGTGGDQDPETFPREYVQKLRRESAGYRARAQRADEAARRLLALTVREATSGILADPTDLPLDGDLVDDDGWPDPEKIKAAAEELVQRKPHLGDRRPRGDVGQGARPDTQPVNLAELIRRRAG